MVIFQYNLYIFGIHLSVNRVISEPCYNEPCYKEVVVYILFQHEQHCDLGMKLIRGRDPLQHMPTPQHRQTTNV